MIRLFANSELKPQVALGYLLLAVSVSALLSLFLPGAVAPFVTAFFVFPIYFYYVRKEMYKEALWLMAFCALLQITAIVSIGMATGSNLSGWSVEVFQADISQDGDYYLVWLTLSRFADLVLTAMLSLVSGGAFAVILGVLAVNHSASSIISVLLSGSGWDAVFLDMEPWGVARIVGHAMVAMAFASVFYMKLEKRPLSLKGPIRLLVFGVAFAVMDIYLQHRLGTLWHNAKNLSLSLLHTQ